MAFATDVQSSQDSGSGLSVSEYVAIGVCSILLGLIYVASVFLYLHTRKKKQKETKQKDGEAAHLTVGEEGQSKLASFSLFPQITFSAPFTSKLTLQQFHYILHDL